MLRFRVRQRPIKFGSYVEGLGSGPEGRLKRLRKHVTALFRDERVESTYAQCIEARGYAEKLIIMAVRNGHEDKHTMEMVNNWLLEKEVIHKLFKVLVPRYKNMPVAATSLYRISTKYPSGGVYEGVLELKGNPWPSVLPRQKSTNLQLHNILVETARKDYQAEQRARSSGTPPATLPPSHATLSTNSGDPAGKLGDVTCGQTHVGDDEDYDVGGHNVSGGTITTNDCRSDNR